MPLLKSKRPANKQAGRFLARHVPFSSQQEAGVPDFLLKFLLQA